MHDPIPQFRDAIQAMGLMPPEHIEQDGNLHRFSSNGKRTDTAGWYVFYEDTIPAGSFGCWRTGLSQNWRTDIGRELTHAEESAYRAKVAAMQKQHEEDKAARHLEAATNAKAIWNSAQPASHDHPYLIRKGIKPHGARLHKDALIIPLRANGETHSLQTVYPDGNKRFLTGGRITGCYFSIGNPKEAAALCIVEGFATGASVHEATDFPVAVAFNAGNLEAVAKSMRKRFPDIQIILCADDDYRTEGNPGITKAKEAAHAINGLLAIPDFGTDRPEGATDFNDLHQSLGPGAVRESIQKASEPDSCVSDSEVPEASIEDDIARLATLSRVEYDRVRKPEAKRLGIRESTLDNLIKEIRDKDNKENESPFDEIEPWHEAVKPDELLSEIAAIIKRFIICEPETIHAATLWTAMTWFMDVVQVAPLAVITAPEKRCGKSQLLFLLGRMTCKPLAASNITPAALFRSIDKWQPTLLIDEADAFMRENEELRGLLNCGHTRESAFSIRTVGDDHTPTRFNLWGAKALAGIGHLADTLMDRAIILELRRRLPCEHVERLRHADESLFHTIQRKLARFAEDYSDTIRKMRPNLPEALHDRAQDNWEPLFAIADVAGNEWSEMAKRAALKLSGDNESTQSRGVELLADIQEVFEIKRINKIFTANLVEALCEDSEKSWSTYNRGKPITPSQLSRRLSEYGISSKSIRIDYENKKGFEKNQFDDAFARYLFLPLQNADISVTPSQANVHAGFSVTARNVTDTPVTQNVTLKASTGAGCDGVTVKNAIFEGAANTNIVEVEL